MGNDQRSRALVQEPGFTLSSEFANCEMRKRQRVKLNSASATVVLNLLAGRFSLTNSEFLPDSAFLLQLNQLTDTPVHRIHVFTNVEILVRCYLFFFLTSAFIINEPSV